MYVVLSCFFAGLTTNLLVVTRAAEVEVAQLAPPRLGIVGLYPLAAHVAPVSGHRCRVKPFPIFFFFSSHTIEETKTQTFETNRRTPYTHHATAREATTEQRRGANGCVRGSPRRAVGAERISNPQTGQVEARQILHATIFQHKGT